MAELQITPEYFGKHRHLVFFAPLWKEFYDSDTFARGPGSTVAKVLDGSVYPYQLTGVAGVANTGSDRNWTGHDFSQANWYAFGRLAWNPDLTAEHIADEWLRMTFTDDSKALATLTQLMLSSWETFVDYDAPLGLTHLQADARDGPDPGSTALPRADWNPPYYHHADKNGIGFDRTATGSNAVSQYFPPVRDQFANLRTCPEKFLLWFHHVPWSHKLSTGRTVWEELCHRYGDGCARAQTMGQTWQSVEAAIDPDRFRAVADRLALQASDARRWRDRAVTYFQKVSHLPAPAYLQQPPPQPH
jgi:alpha-glucuronidase